MYRLLSCLHRHGLQHLLPHALLLASLVNQGPRHQDSKPSGLQPAVAVPRLSHAAHAKRRIEQEETHQPHEEGTHGLQHGAENGAELPRHHHAHHVIKSQSGAVHQQDHLQRAAVADHGECVKDVLMHPFALLARQKVGDRRHDAQRPNHTKHALPSHNLGGCDVEVGHEKIFKGKLGSLYCLRDDDESHANEVLLRSHCHHHAALAAQVAAGAHQDHTQQATTDAPKMESIELASQERDCEQCGKQHFSPTHHLIYTGCDVQQAHIHENGGKQVKEGGDGQHHDFLEVASLGLGSLRLC
mmetsp:Transcript_16818/g.28828  ORF Transcript_16818/g.28828 Transcript_16818/m.28828 type:complete len:300 (-) Transcript_16818:302-1201(-)